MKAWCWTPEDWTWKGVKPADLQAITNDLLAAAIAAAQKVKAPFQLVTCGWVLGPQQDRAMFDKILPKEVALSCINRDGRLPRPADWVRGPGGIRPDKRRWENVRKDYEFVDEFAALRPNVNGAGNMERFDYWLNNVRYMRAMAQVNCTWFLFTNALARAKAQQEPSRTGACSA